MMLGGRAASHVLAETSALLLGRQVGVSRALTWLPEGVLGECARQQHASVAEALARLCASAGVRLAFLPAALSTRSMVEELAGSGVATASVVDGVFGRVARQMGWSEAIAASAHRHRELEELLRTAAADAGVESLAVLETGASAVVIADDVAGSSGPLVDPDFASRALLPHYSAILAPWSEAGKPAVFHSDGDVRWLYRDLAAVGFSAVHVTPGADTPTVAEMFAAAAHAGLCPIGGLRAAALEIERAQEAVGQVIEEIADSGVERVFVADDGGITDAAQLSALVEVFKHLD